MKKIVLLFILISSYAFSQSVNDYQYVMIPAKFEGFKENDKFRLNTNVKLLLQKYGFKSFLSSDSIPNEIANSNCNKLYADLVTDNNFLSTKIKIVLKDCREKVIYETAFGKSNEKEFTIAYNQALREAGKSFDKLNYKYNGKIGAATVNTAANGPQTNPVSTPTSVNDSQPVVGETTSEVISRRLKVVKTTDGFELYDSSNVLVLTARKTSVVNVFIAKAGNENGILQRGKDFNWYFDYYRIGSSKLISEVLDFNF